MKFNSRVAEIVRELDLKEVQRWTLLSTIVGVVGGLVAVLFYSGLYYSTYYLLGGIGGYYPATPGGDIDLLVVPPSNPHHLLLILLPALGGLVAGFLVYGYAPETEGHGTDSVIDSYHRHRGVIRTRVPFIKAAASMITIGSGGSAGREGPIAQISAGFGSVLATKLNLTERDRRILVICGMAAGIGSIFKAPLGGAIFAIEVLYRQGSESEGIVPAFISSTIAYSIFCSFFGWDSLFSMPDYQFNHPNELIFYALLGIAAAAVGIFYIHVFCGLRDLFRKLAIPKHFKPAIGGLLLGIMAFFVPQSLGVGYGLIQLTINQELLVGSLIILLFAKIIATSFSISSGGSGGVFGPTLVVGAMLGGFLGITFNTLFPTIVIEYSTFVLVGMAALLAGVAKTPIAAIIMVSELTGNYNLLPPLMLASTLAYVMSGKWSIYEKQVPSRIDSPAHRREMTIDVLELVSVKDVMCSDIITVSPATKVQTVLNLIHKYRHIGYPVLDNLELVGMVTFEDAEKVPFDERDTIQVKEIMTRSLVVTYEDETLESALRKLLDNKIGRLPVVDRNNPTRMIGMLTKSDIIREHAQLSSKFCRLPASKRQL
ncbi:MAG: chloride channel protein [ANME-2 cluster archaeon]|nr:chloride channel protein [ANME-2 cluster archaeon]